MQQNLTYEIVQLIVHYIMANPMQQNLKYEIVQHIVNCIVVGLVISVPGSFLLSHLIDERAERTA